MACCVKSSSQTYTVVLIYDAVYFHRYVYLLKVLKALRGVEYFATGWNSVHCLIDVPVSTRDGLVAIHHRRALSGPRMEHHRGYRQRRAKKRLVKYCQMFIGR